MKHKGGVLALLIFLSSCIEKKDPLTAAQIRAKADSVFAGRVADMKKQYTDDLEQRLTIELKPKVDSIIKARETVIPSAPTPNPSAHAEP